MAVNLRPNSAGFKLGYAQALGHLGEPEKGIEVIEEALRFSPRDPNLASMHYNLGVLRLQLGHFDQAVGSFLQSRRIRPSFSRVHVNLAIAYAHLKRLDEASLCLAEARRLNPHLRLLSKETLDGSSPSVDNYIYRGLLKLEEVQQLPVSTNSGDRL